MKKTFYQYTVLALNIAFIFLLFVPDFAKLSTTKFFIGYEKAITGVTVFLLILAFIELLIFFLITRNKTAFLTVPYLIFTFYYDVVMKNYNYFALPAKVIIWLLIIIGAIKIIESVYIKMNEQRFNNISKKVFVVFFIETSLLISHYIWLF